MNKTLKGCLAILLTIGIGKDASAIGGAFIGNEVPSARAAGQGYVGVAGQNEDPTAVFTNPAAMTALKGTQITVGAHWENIHPSYEDNSGNVTKANTTNVVVPNFSMTQSFLDGKLAAGLSSQSPYGLETHWDANSPMGYTATNSRLNMVDITPAIAYQVHPKISIGAGVDYVNLFNAQLDSQFSVTTLNAILNAMDSGTFPTTQVSPDGLSSLKGSAAGWGYHAGLVYNPTEQHSVGLSYHSKVNLRVNGNITISGIDPASNTAGVFGAGTYTTSAYTDLLLPTNVQLGYAFKPTSKWVIETDAAWYHWSEAKDINIRYPAANATQQSILSGGNMRLDARDAWSFAVGTNYKASDRWQYRTGFWYEPWALPESTFSPAFMDLSRYGLSVGSGYGITDSLTLDVAYTAVFMHNRHISNGDAPTGTYKNFANLLAFNFTYRFGNAK